MTQFSLAQIIEQIDKDLTYHAKCIREAVEHSTDWNFHLGWVDALTAYRWKLKELAK